jgi:large repetitive protein
VAVTVYVAECNDASLCSSWAGPSGQVVPYEPIATPAVTATGNGTTTISYTWSAQSDGLTETLNVCIAGSCTDHAVPATGGTSGSATGTYGYSQTETITAHLTDTAGQSSGTATASATTGAAPANPSVSVAENGSTTNGTDTCAGKTCYFFAVSAANFPDSTGLTYTCADSGGVYWGPTSIAKSGSTTTNGSGSASFTTECIHANDGETVTITVSGGGKSASGTYKT